MEYFMNDRIRTIRVYLGLTQEEFAEKLFMKRNSITQIELGNRNPSNRLIKAISDIFSINENWIRTGNGDMIKQMNDEDIINTWIDTILETKMNDIKHNLALNLRNMSKDNWMVLCDIANILNCDCNKANLLKSIINLSESECEILCVVLNGIKNKI